MSQSRDPLSTAIMIGLVRSLPVIVLGVGYLVAREQLTARIGGGLNYFAPPLFLVTVAFIVARTVIKRRDLLPSSRRQNTDEEPASFDADAAFERYLATKDKPSPRPLASMEAPPAQVATPPRAANPAPYTAPPRGGFGRKPVQP